MILVIFESASAKKLARCVITIITTNGLTRALFFVYIVYTEKSDIVLYMAVLPVCIYMYMAHVLVVYARREKTKVY